MLPIDRRRARKPKARRAAKKTITLSAISAGAMAIAATALSAGTASAATALSAGTASAAASGGHPGFSARVILSGASLRHTFVKAGSAKPHTDPLTLPDDITAAGPYLFTAFQNGVGPRGRRPRTATGIARWWSSPAAAARSASGTSAASATA